MNTDKASLTFKGMFRSKLVRLGLIVWAVGCGPLIAVGIIGVLNGTNPNPVGLGIMTMFAAPAGLFCIGLGALLYFIGGGDHEDKTKAK